ncbi:hypothetical protein FB451DRAFT_1172131 [Mycena latifolia]|nr:hypothetical protein FB451DRAFT_1172131 [Mycena latifolia]
MADRNSRYPLRNRRPLTHPDSPVSYALVARPIMEEEIISSSDESAENPGQNSADSDVEVLDGPPNAPSAQRESSLSIEGSPYENHPIHRVLTDHGSEIIPTFHLPEDGVRTWTTMAGLGHNLRLLSGERLFLNFVGRVESVSDQMDLEQMDITHETDGSLAATERRFMARVDAPGLTYRQRADLLIREIYRLRGQPHPSTVSNALPVPPPVTQALHTPLDHGASIYYVGIQTPTQSGTFVQLQHLAAPDSTLLARLIQAGFPLGRTLRAIPAIERSAFLIGTADIPVDITMDYMNHRNNFRELGSWPELETSPVLGLLAPIPQSPARSELLVSRNVPEDTSVYVLYVYHENSNMLFANAAVAPILTARAPAVPAPIVAAPGAVPQNPVTLYLRQHFPEQYASVAYAQATYGSAYQHCLIERYVMEVARAVGITFANRSIIPAAVNGLTIRLDDVAIAANIPAATFSTFRTELGKARKARKLVQRYQRRLALSPVPLFSDITIHPKLIDLLATLDAMLGEHLLDPGLLADGEGTVQAHAVSMTIGNLMADIAQATRWLGTIAV